MRSFITIHLLAHAATSNTIGQFESGRFLKMGVQISITCRPLPFVYAVSRALSAKTRYSPSYDSYLLDKHLRRVLTRG